MLATGETDPLKAAGEMIGGAANDFLSPITDVLKKYWWVLLILFLPLVVWLIYSFVQK
jgi:hypothetical protein